MWSLSVVAVVAIAAITFAPALAHAQATQQPTQVPLTAQSTEGQSGAAAAPELRTIAAHLAELRKLPAPDVDAVDKELARLAAIGTTPALRELVATGDDHGGVHRPEIARLLTPLGERAVPALIETKLRSKSLHKWAIALLESMGKRTAADAVQTKSNLVLAEVLHAYAVSHETDAIPVVLSFVSSDRAQVREAARDAILLYGKEARTQLRESYSNLVGHNAPDEWDEAKLARELFAAYDRTRLHEVYALLDEGVAKAKAAQGDPKQLGEAVAILDKVLARQPMLDRRIEMIPVYVQYAKTIEDESPELALASYEKAQRLDPEGPRAGQIASAIATLEAKALLARGIEDRAALERAARLDPANTKAREELDRLDAKSEARHATLKAWATAAALLFVALAATILLWPRRRVSSR
ncbi:MAG: hypothetical protein JWM74_3264 [Myxococcaceae bacterium]|nr:hypothetical protein [Myxococcaceae bacterium]